MRIRSTTVDGHQFTRSRRGGYDAAEVDAVMARIADTLRDYEDQAEDLEGRLAAAETAVRVARPKGAAPMPGTENAREHATEIMQRAEAEAVARRAEIAALLESARREAEDLRVETEQARSAVETEQSDLSRLRDAATAEAEDIRAGARRDAEAIRAAATREAQALLSAALGEARALRTAALADASELQDARVDEALAEIADEREVLETERAETAETARRTVAALAEAEEERVRLETRLSNLRTTVRAIEHQMHALAGDITARAGEIGGLADIDRATPVPGEGDDDVSAVEDARDASSAVAPTSLPVSGFQAPQEHAPLATAEPSAVFVVDEAEGDFAQTADTYTFAQHHAYAEPDGSGRPPADRATIVPEVMAEGPPTPEDHQGPYRTVYQRAGRNLRARLRQEGQDPTQRGR